MGVYLVTWNLNEEKENYDKKRAQFLHRLERFPNISDPRLDSVRFIETNATARGLSVYLREALDKNDRLVITKMNKGEYAGWLSVSVWQWINARV